MPIFPVIQLMGSLVKTLTENTKEVSKVYPFLQSINSGLQSYENTSVLPVFDSVQPKLLLVIDFSASVGEYCDRFT